MSKNGDIFEKRLIVKHIEVNGTCPITNEAMTLDDLIPVRLANSNAVKPRQLSATSIPGLLQVPLFLESRFCPSLFVFCPFLSSFLFFCSFLYLVFFFFLSFFLYLFFLFLFFFFNFPFLTLSFFRTFKMNGTH